MFGFGKMDLRDFLCLNFNCMLFFDTVVQSWSVKMSIVHRIQVFHCNSKHSKIPKLYHTAKHSSAFLTFGFNFR